MRWEGREGGLGFRLGKEMAQGLGGAAEAPVGQESERVEAAGKIGRRLAGGAAGAARRVGAGGGVGAFGDGAEDSGGALVAAGNAVEGFDPDFGEEVVEEGDGGEDGCEESIERHHQRERGVGLGLLLGGLVGLGHGDEIAQRGMGGKGFVRLFDSRWLTVEVGPWGARRVQMAGQSAEVMEYQEISWFAPLTIMWLRMVPS